jgi:hypothetical protein
MTNVGLSLTICIVFAGVQFSQPTQTLCCNESFVVISEIKAFRSNKKLRIKKTVP